jgi:hypothetical protein
MNNFAKSLQEFSLSASVSWLCWQQRSWIGQINKIAFKGQMNSFGARA